METSSDISELDGFVPEGEEQVKGSGVVLEDLEVRLEQQFQQIGLELWSEEDFLEDAQKAWFGCIWLRSQGKTNRGIA